MLSTVSAIERRSALKHSQETQICALGGEKLFCVLVFRIQKASCLLKFLFNWWHHVGKYDRGTETCCGERETGQAPRGAAFALWTNVLKTCCVTFNPACVLKSPFVPRRLCFWNTKVVTLALGHITKGITQKVCWIWVYPSWEHAVWVSSSWVEFCEVSDCYDATLSLVRFDWLWNQYPFIARQRALWSLSQWSRSTCNHKFHESSAVDFSGVNATHSSSRRQLCWRTALFWGCFSAPNANSVD